MEVGLTHSNRLVLARRGGGLARVFARRVLRVRSRVAELLGGLELLLVENLGLLAEGEDGEAAHDGPNREGEHGRVEGGERLELVAEQAAADGDEEDHEGEVERHREGDGARREHRVEQIELQRRKDNEAGSRDPDSPALERRVIAASNLPERDHDDLEEYDTQRAAQRRAQAGGDGVMERLLMGPEALEVRHPAKQQPAKDNADRKADEHEEARVPERVRERVEVGRLVRPGPKDGRDRHADQNHARADPVGDGELLLHARNNARGGDQAREDHARTGQRGEQRDGCQCHRERE
mmetsp:Transcript_26113/g.76331  ORF Transcript_26113/g.76331 Transcript_26113/m.76331 type:complete len:295 (-) Transcript_26113:215-1099(-)